MNTPDLITRARLRAQNDSTHDAMLAELADALEYTEKMRVGEQGAARDFHKQLREWVLLVERNNDLLPAGNNLLCCLEVFFEQCRAAKEGK